MTPFTEELVKLARAARRRAHAPYSRFYVGAAVRTSDGRTFSGANVENASYGLSICAERASVVAAVNASSPGIVELAVALGGSPPVAPCGACRQTLTEFAGDLPITVVNERDERLETTLAELLPRAFRPDDLPR